MNINKIVATEWFKVNWAFAKYSKKGRFSTNGDFSPEGYPMQITYFNVAGFGFEATFFNTEILGKHYIVYPTRGKKIGVFLDKKEVYVNEH